MINNNNKKWTITKMDYDLGLYLESATFRFENWSIQDNRDSKAKIGKMKKKKKHFSEQINENRENTDWEYNYFVICCKLVINEQWTIHKFTKYNWKYKIPLQCNTVTINFEFWKDHNFLNNGLMEFTFMIDNQMSR